MTHLNFGRWMKTGFAGMMLLALAACAKDSGDAKPAAPPPAPVAATDSAAGDAAPAASDGAWTLRADGVGPVRVGMTLAEAAAAIPGGLADTSRLEHDCGIAKPRTGPRGLALMVVKDTVVRVEVADSGASIATALGARSGDSEARIRQLYPAARVQPHKYDPGAHYFIVIPGAPADTIHRIVFETDGKVVRQIRGGLYPPVEYVEGCS
jgi:hypothetical protein